MEGVEPDVPRLPIYEVNFHCPTCGKYWHGMRFSKRYGVREQKCPECKRKEKENGENKKGAYMGLQRKYEVRFYCPDCGQIWTAMRTKYRKTIHEMVCDSCKRKKDNKRRVAFQQERNRLIAAGICTTCKTAKAMAGSTMCHSCAEEREAKRRALCGAPGECMRCTYPEYKDGLCERHWKKWVAQGRGKK